ncbi:MAG: D-alanine--D-alanine ligase [Granulosicoccaceae bacterium]
MTPTAAQLGKVAVVMGGWSAEREVSLMSGKQVCDALRDAGIDATAVDADQNIASVLAAGGYKRSFLMLHGRGGEDGCVQGALDLIGMPYTGSGVLGSALAMDKMRSKIVCTAQGIPTPDAFMASTIEEASVAARNIGFPVVVKPTLEGSSIGVSMVDSAAEIADAFNVAAQHGPLMIEKRMLGREVTAAIINGQCLPLVSMKAQGGFYDYDAKYLAQDTHYECPVVMPEELSKEIEQYALAAFEALACKGWGRVDFMLDDQQRPHFIECNTAPGMTSHSLVPMAAAAANMDFVTLCLNILAQTLNQQELAA